MSLLYLVIILVLIGVAMWALNNKVPMSAGWKKLINIVVCVCVAIWLLQVFGIFGAAKSVPVPTIH